MIIELESVFNTDGLKIPFDYELSLSGITVSGLTPVTEPVKVSGYVETDAAGSNGYMRGVGVPLDNTRIGFSGDVTADAAHNRNSVHIYFSPFGLRFFPKIDYGEYCRHNRKQCSDTDEPLGYSACHEPFGDFPGHK